MVRFQVNDILVDLPFKHGTQLQVYISGVHGFIKTDFEVIVTFNWHSYARVILPNTYARSVCGLCGNADGNPQDDFALPDGQQAADEIRFADSWKVADVPGCWAGCAEGCEGCTEAEKRAYRGDKHCGLLVKQGGPFAACHGAVDPTSYFDDCLFDTCLYKGHQETVCHSLGAYVTACQSQGVRLKPWRTAAFCSTWAWGGDLRGVAGARAVGVSREQSFRVLFADTEGLGLALTKSFWVAQGLPRAEAFWFACARVSGWRRGSGGSRG